ncbi:hypothetical protein C4097_07180 [Clostridioides difficile]|nr:hypothetical protein [Clostridioides difficile]
METLNCIDRLHYIVKEFNSTITINLEGKPIDKLNQVISRMFDINKDDAMKVYSTYGSIFELCNNCLNTIDKIAPFDENSSKNEFMKSRIENVMCALCAIDLPDGDFKEFKSTLNTDTLSNLKMLSYSINSSDIVITENQLDKIRDDIRLILDEIINSGISIKLKDLLSDRINEILNVVEKYKIYGSDEILKAYETCIGTMLINKSIVEDKDMPLYQNIFLKLMKTISFLNENLPLIQYAKELMPKLLK